MVQKAPRLKGKTVAITRPVGQAKEAGKLIKEIGGVPYYIPAIEIKGLSNFSSVKKIITELLKGQVDYVIFMSTNGVKYLFGAAETLKQTGELKEGLGKTFVIAVGPRTAQALKRGFWQKNTHSKNDQCNTNLNREAKRDGRPSGRGLRL
jgi:uroporphyrinogen-III synthase